MGSRYLDYVRQNSRRSSSVQLTSKSILILLAFVAMGASAVYWWGVQSTLLPANHPMALAFTAILVLAPPSLVSFLIPWSPGGMLLQKVNAKTWGHTAVVGCAVYLLYYSFQIQWSWAALLAKELGDSENYEKLMKRTDSYKHLFDPSTQFMRGRLKDGTWITPFDPKRPFYEYMYREANGWQSTFFAPHDSEGFIALYPSKKAFENKLDSLFMIPWDGYEAHNLTTFIGQYCHGNQPGHSSIYMYYFVDKQEKAQKLLNRVLNGYYRMGPKKLAYSGMDDAGEMSSWYVLNAIGLYTYSPADPEYIVTVPLFEKVIFNLDGTDFIITRKGAGEKINEIRYGEKILDSYFISHSQLKEGKELIIVTN